MSRLARFIAMFCWLLLFAAGVTSLLAADVEVRLADGRTLRGAVVEKEISKEQLTLEQRSSGITIRRTLTWDQIVDVRVVPRQTRVVREIVSPKPVVPAEGLRQLQPLPLPLSQLLVKADPMSSFGKMDWDSLRVTLRGVNEQGDTVQLGGTLKVTLWGQQRVRPESRIVRYPIVTDANFGSRYLSAPSNVYAYQHPYVMSPNPIVEVCSWTRRIDVETAGGVRDSAIDERVRLANTWGSTGNWQETRVGARQDGRRVEAQEFEGCDTVLVLPLQRPLPDHDVWVGTFGEVTVELLMPGVGVFTASAPDIVLSHQNALRREMLDGEGSRFYPNESTTDDLQRSRSRHRFIWPGGVSGPERGILPIQP